MKTRSVISKPINKAFILSLVMGGAVIVMVPFLFASFAFAATVTYPNTTQVEAWSNASGTWAPTDNWQNSFGGDSYYAKNITFTSSPGSVKVEIETGFKPASDLPSGDFGFSTGSSTDFNYGVSFTDHDGFIQGGIYSVSAWKDPLENGSWIESYGGPSNSNITPAQIKQGTLIGNTTVTRTDLTNGDSLFSFDISLPVIVNASSFGYIWATAICGNGVINGIANIPSSPSPATLHVIKNVINDNGGTVLASAFTLHVKLSGSDVAGSPASGTGTPGTAYSLSAGTYVVSENTNASYASTFSGDCDSNGNVILASGDNKTCTITNNDIAGPSPLDDDCTVTPATGNVGDIFTWRVNPSGGTGVYTYVWSGDEGLTGATVSVTKIYGTAGTKNGTINVTSGSQTITKSCSATVSTPPPVCTTACGSGPLVYPPIIHVTKVANPTTLPVVPGLVTYNYAVSNSGTVALSNITINDNKCSPVSFIYGDINNDSKLDINETWKYSCTATISQNTTNTVVVTGHANGSTVTDTANATVVVVPGFPNTGSTPISIHLTKIPSPQKLPSSGGMVTYTYTATNTGTVALSNIYIVDDKCSPINYISGDTNLDAKLDTTEAWIFTCQTKINKTTTNTAVITGEANGLTVQDTTTANVLVPVPGFPKTGFSPFGGSGPWNIIIILGDIIVVLTAFFVIFKKPAYESR